MVHNLRCEYAENPLGLDVAVPRFSWQLVSPRRGAAQAAYRLQVADSAAALAADSGTLWDSGWVASAQSVNVEYAGRELRSRERCFWSVAVRDGQGGTATAAAPAWFEMGLLHPADWQTQWIGMPAAGSGRGLLLRREFELEKPVVWARLYAAGLGFYEVRINGNKLGDAVLEPAPTTTSRRVLYTTHELTASLRPGKNVIGAMLGNGWHGAPKFLAQLEIRFADGTARTLLTGGAETPMHWLVAPGPVTGNGVYDGEDYDARLDRAGWDAPETPLSEVWQVGGWMAAMAVDPPGGRLASAVVAEPIMVVETIRPPTVTEPRPGLFVFDLGRNVAGWARLRVHGPAGTRIGLAFAETVHADGTINRDNLRTARAADSYTLKGADGIEEWEPRFTYHGFRYVQVEGWPGTPTADALDGRVVRSAVATRGTFACDHDLLNRLHRAIVATEAGNLHGIPTDCPQRDERMGWLNDLTARAEEAMYNFDLARFFTKFLDDIADAQDPVTGALPCTVPYHFGSRPTDPVCICYLLLPWLLYRHYGDRRVLRRHYPGMKAWVECLTARTGPDGVLRFSHYGDWAPPAVGEQAKFGADAVNHTTPGALVSTGFLAYHAALLAEIADLLGAAADAGHYRGLATSTTTVFNREFWDETAGGYGQNNQSANALALYAGLVPPDRVARVAANLLQDVAVTNDHHLTTGNICTKYLLEVLTAHGQADTAFRVATQTTYPGWGFMLAHGATTLWERWEQATGTGMNSHNHPMLGSVGAWLYRHLAGLQVAPDAVAGDRMLIRPHVVPELNTVTATLETLHGPLACAWERTGEALLLRLTLPPGVTAAVTLRTPHAPEAVTESGTPLTAATGVAAVHRDGADLCFIVASGTYAFRLPQVSANHTFPIPAPLFSLNEGLELCPCT